MKDFTNADVVVFNAPTVEGETKVITVGDVNEEGLVRNFGVQEYVVYKSTEVKAAACRIGK